MNSKLKGLLFTLFSISLAGGVLMQFVSVIEFGHSTSLSGHLRIWLTLAGAAILWGVVLWLTQRDGAKR